MFKYEDKGMIPGSRNVVTNTVLPRFFAPKVVTEFTKMVRLGPAVRLLEGNWPKMGSFWPFSTRDAVSARFMLSWKYEAGCIYREGWCVDSRPG